MHIYMSVCCVYVCVCVCVCVCGNCHKRITKNLENEMAAVPEMCSHFHIE